MNATPSRSPSEQTASETIPEAERQRCEIWTRVMGYHRPVAAFNPGKKGEFAERREFRAQTVERALRGGAEQGECSVGAC